MCRAKGR
jgi:hypothetical protein